MDKAKRVAEMVQPVIIPFSSLCHADLATPDTIFIWKSF